MKPLGSAITVAVPFLILALILGCGGKSKATAPVEPPCSLSETSISFGSVWLGQSTTRTLNLVNTGSGTLEGTLTSNQAEFAVVEAAASYRLAPGESQAFTIRFAPSAGGSRSGEIATGSVCGSVHVSGVGQVAGYGVQDTTLAFGRFDPNLSMGWWIDNSGGSAALRGTITSPCANFKLVDDTHNLNEVSSITYDIPAGGSYDMAVVFRPTSGGWQSCVLQTGLPAFPRLVCTGYGQFCGVAPTGLSFGTAWDWRDQQFTVTNTDSLTLTGSVAENYPDLLVSSNNYSLAPGASKTVTVQWLPAPPLNAGAKIYLIDTGLPTCSDVTASAGGEGIDPLYSGGCVYVTNGTACQGGGVVCFDLPTIHVGQSTSVTVDLRNVCGTSTNPVSLNLVEFSDHLSCNPALFSGFGSGDTRSSVVTFTPAVSGTHHLRVRLFETSDGGVTYKATGEVMFQGTVLP